MKKAFVLFSLFFYTSHINAQFQMAKAPVADKKEYWRTLHDDRVLDNYYWMYDYFGKGPDSTKVVDYLKAENTYLDAVMTGTKKFQTDLFKEMKARIKEKDETVPVYKNGFHRPGSWLTKRQSLHRPDSWHTQRQPHRLLRAQRV